MDHYGLADGYLSMELAKQHIQILNSNSPVNGVMVLSTSNIRYQSDNCFSYSWNHQLSNDRQLYNNQITANGDGSLSSDDNHLFIPISANCNPNAMSTM